MSSREKVTGSYVRIVSDSSNASLETEWGQNPLPAGVKETCTLRSSDCGEAGRSSSLSGSSSRPADSDDIDNLSSVFGKLSFAGSIEEAAVSAEVRPKVEVEDIETLESAIRFAQSQSPPGGISPLREFRSDRKELTVTDLVGPAWYVLIMFSVTVVRAHPPKVRV